MDEELSSRLSRLRTKLFCGEQRFRKNGSRLIAKRANRFKYTPKNVVNRSMFLPGRFKVLITQYENSVNNIMKRFPGFYVHNPQAFFNNIKNIVCSSRHGTFHWDTQWLNPVVLASRGWDVLDVQEMIITLHCRCCAKRWPLDLSETESKQDIRKLYHDQLSDRHAVLCPWKTTTVDIGRYYCLKESNIAADLERIAESLSRTNVQLLTALPTVTDAVERISKLFGAFNDKTPLLCIYLKGYQLVPEGALECSRCFYRSTLESLLENVSFNGHAVWCRYACDGRLEKMLLALSDATASTAGLALSDRIKQLENIIMNM